MRIVIAIISTVIMSVGTVFGQMTDEQVIRYTKQAYSQGMSNEQIASALISRGVTQEQILRIKNNMNEEMGIRSSRGVSDRGAAYRSRSYIGEIGDSVRNNRPSNNNSMYELDGVSDTVSTRVS